MATLPPGTAGYYALSVPALQRDTKYILTGTITNDVDAPCRPNTQTIGSFTTQ
jgi:hypothetical protein